MLRRALQDLAVGKPVLLYDLDGRENETDMIVAGQRISPGHIATLRTQAGGLICAAISGKIAGALGLPYLRDILLGSGSESLRQLSSPDAPYGGSPAFSITLNHKDTYTGITDLDRSKTVQELARLIGEVEGDPEGNWAGTVADRFRSPGHVHVLIGSDLAERQGHTELSLRLAEMSCLHPIVVICEMLDKDTHRALSKEHAALYSQRRGLAMVEASEILDTGAA
jgi:3,4-dihydroxy 2-butanone 4-phosphate synthase